MKLKEIGEWGLIQEIARLVGPPSAPVLLGIGDDAALWKSQGSVQVATTDTLAQDTHFRLEHISWLDLGWKALAVNLSDIAAMGGVPDYALVSLGLSGEREVGEVVDLYRGLLDIARLHQVEVVGGDLFSFPSVIITVTVLGHLRSKASLNRGGARPGEQVAVTGYLGASAAGLGLLTSGWQVNAETASLLTQAHCRPQPRVQEGQTLLRSGVRAAIDVSDGLLSDLRQVCLRSQVGAKIRLSQVPVHPRLEEVFGPRAWELALGGGEDYELLFTAPASVLQRIDNVAFSIIGEITAGPPGHVEVVDDQGKPIPWSKSGWEHFRL